MVYLHEDREQFLQALRLTYKQTRQMMQIIEKIIMLLYCLNC